MKNNTLISNKSNNNHPKRQLLKIEKVGRRNTGERTTKKIIKERQISNQYSICWTWAVAVYELWNVKHVGKIIKSGQ